MTTRERQAARKAATTDKQNAALRSLLADFGYVLEGRNLQSVQPYREHTMTGNVDGLLDAAEYLQPILKSDAYYYRLEAIRQMAKESRS